MEKFRKTHKWAQHIPNRRKHAAPIHRLCNTLPLGLHQYQLQPSGELIFLGGNPAADKILGIDHQAYVGKPIETVFPYLAHTEIPDAYRQIARNGGSIERELVNNQEKQIAGFFKIQAFQMGPNYVSVLFQEISDKKQTERSLAESEERYRRLFEDAVLGIFQSSPEGKALAVNPAFARMFGYSSPQDVLATVQNVASDIFADPNRRAEIAQMVRENPELKTFENIYRRKDGSTFPGTLHLHPVLNTDGQLLYFEGLIEDISERKRAEVEIHDLAKFPEENPNPVARISREGVLLFANQAAASLLSTFTLEVGQTIPPNWRDYLNQVLRDGQYKELEIQQNGRIFAFQLIPFLEESYVNVYGLDVTKRKEAEAALQESERQTRSLIEAAPLGLHQYRLLPDGRLIFTGANPAADHILGIDHHTLIDLPIEDAFPTHRQTEIPAIYRKVAQEGIPYSCEQIAYQDNQIQGVFEIHAFQTGPSRMAVFFQDITEKKKAAVALEESEEKYRMLIEKNSEGVILYDELGLTVEWNAAQEHISGISRQNALGRPSWDLQFQLLPPEEKTSTRYEEMKERGIGILQSDQSPIFYHPVETSIHRPDGTRSIIQETAFPIKTRSGFRVGSILRDITERKQAEQDLRRRMIELEALEQISGVLRTEENKDKAIQVVLDRLMASLELQGVGLAFIDPQSGDPVTELGMGNWALEKGFHIPQGEEISHQVATSQHYYLNNEVSLDETIQFRNSKLPLKCLLCLALIVDGQTQGLLYLARNTHFLTKDVHLAIAMVDTLAGVLHRIELHDQTRRQLERLTALRTIDQSILSHLELDQTLEVLLDKITWILKVDAADILLFDSRKETLKAAARRGLDSPLWDETLTLNTPHAGYVAQTRMIEIIPDLNLVGDILTKKNHQSGGNFAGYAAVPLVAKGELKGVLQIFTHSRLEASLEWTGFMEALADQAAIAINSAQLFNEQQQTNARLTRAYEDTIDGWSRALDLRDRETEGHSQRVTDLTLELARRMGIQEEQMVHIRRGAKLHDIGKMGIPDIILLKPDKLSEDEWKIMRQHPTFAANLLYPIEFLRQALEIPFSHHEKWDGTGYPHGLKGEEIPLAARIFAVIDVWDALTHARPYRPAWTIPDALAYIREQSGKHFDPWVVENFYSLLNNSGSSQ